MDILEKFERRRAGTAFENLGTAFAKSKNASTKESENDHLLYSVMESSSHKKKLSETTKDVPDEVNGTLSTSVQITNTMIGSGILSFPYVLAHVGIVWSALLLLTFGSSVYLTSNLMIETGRRRGVMDFSMLVEDVFGYTMARVLDFCIALSNMGALMSYFNTIGTLGSCVLKKWIADSIWINSYSGFMVVFVTLVELPLIVIRSYGELAIVSFGSLAFISIVILFVAVEGHDTGEVAFYTPNLWPESDINIMKYLGSFAYAYSCQYVVFEAYASMTTTAKRRWKSSLLGSVYLGGFLLTSMALFGYAAVGQSAASDILVSFDANKVAVQVAMLVVVLHLLLYMPNDFVIMRLFALRIFNLNPLQLSRSKFIMVTLALFIPPLLLMAAVPEEDVDGVFSLIISLTGDLPSGFSLYLLPNLMYMIVFYDERGVKWYASAVVCVLGGLLVFLCPYLDLRSFIDACRSSAGCSSY